MTRFLRFFDRWYLTHWRSFAALSAGSSVGGTSRTRAPPAGAVDRANDTPTLWQVIEGFSLLGYLHIQASLPRLLLSGTLLAPLRLVALHTLVLSVALSASSVSCTGAHNSASPGRPVICQPFFKWITLRPQSSTLLVQKPQIPKPKTRQSPRRPRVQKYLVNLYTL